MALRKARRLWRGNFVAILRGNVLIAALGLVAGLVLAKFLEPNGRGILAIALAWSGLGLAFLGLGVGNAASFFAARHPDRRGEVLRAALQLSAASTVAILTVGFTAATLLVRDRSDLYVALLIAFLGTPFALVSGVGRGMLNVIDLKLWSRVRLVQPAVFAGTLILFAVIGHLTVVAGAVSYLASLVVSTGWVWWLSSPSIAPSRGRAFRELRRGMLRYGIKSSLGTSAQVTNVRLDVAVIGIFLPVSQVGLYAVASSLAQYILPLSTAAAPWVFPRIARAAPTARSWADAQRAVRLTAALAAAMALLTAVAAPFILGRVLGSQWLAALVPLWILLLGAVMQSVRFTQVSIAQAYHRPELTAQSEGLAAVVTVITLWPMVHLFGINGAALVSVLAYTTGALLLRRGIRRAVRQVIEPRRDEAGPAVPDLGRDGGTTPIVVTYVERQPSPGRHFSIERVFDAVITGASPGMMFHRVRVPRSGIGPGALLRNILAVRSIRSDVIHVTGDVHYVLPALSRRAVRVLTVHDLASLNRTTGWRRRVIRRLWYTSPLAHADAVTTVSEETRRQLLAEFGSVAGKATVIENALGPGFADVKPRPATESRSLKCPVVLAIGTGANKNLLGTAEAVRRVGATLRIVGKLDEEAMAALDGLGVSWSATHSLDDDELLAEYLNADVLSFPSLHEGFGLPILEAQAVGLPVVTSNLPPMNEVSGGGAVLVDPDQPSEIAEAILAVTRNAALRERLVAQGLHNVSRHSATHIAGEYAALYRGLLERSDGNGRATVSGAREDAGRGDLD